MKYEPIKECDHFPIAFWIDSSTPAYTYVEYIV